MHEEADNPESRKARHAQTARNKEANRSRNEAVPWARAPWSFTEPVVPAYGQVEVKARAAATSTFLPLRSYVSWLNTTKDQQATLIGIVEAVKNDFGNRGCIE